MLHRADAVVVGAGVIGSSVALGLASTGRSVLVVDKAGAVGHGSTSASSAIVRFHYSTYQGVAAAWEAKHCWEDWAGHLGMTDPAGMARYVPTGALVLDTPGYDADRVLRLYDEIGIRYERLGPADIRARFPYLTADRFYPPRAVDDPQFGADPVGELGGFYTPEGGFVDDPGLAAHNLWTAATERGAASVFRATVTQIRRDGHRVGGIRLADGRVLDADIVVNCAGPHSAPINALAGVLDDFA